jgi:hypothetical protein
VWSIGCFDQSWCDWYDIDVMIVIGDPGGGDDVFVGNLNDLWDDYFTTWKEGVFDLNPPSTPFRVGFRYTGLDGDLGVIDNIVIEGSTGPPANDCNENGVPDECDVPPIGTGPDCQPDGIPDECQLEGNDVIPPAGDGVPDECNGCGDGYVNPADEDCELGSGPCCTEDCLFVFAGVACRPADGDCDVTEACTGDSAECPPDGFVAAGTQCRAPVDKCDPPEACTGTGPYCPADDVITECVTGDACCPDGCTWQDDWDCADNVQNPGQIPTMSQWGLLILALLLAVLGKVYFGRRRAAA